MVMKRDVYPVKVIKILPVPSEGPKPPFLKNPHRLAGLYANVRGATVRVVLRIRVSARTWAAQGRNAARTLWIAAAGRYRATVASLKSPTSFPSSKVAVPRSRRPTAFGGQTFGAAKARIRTLRQRVVRKPWPTTPLWTATHLAMASRLRAWKESLRQRLRALETSIADRRRMLSQRWVHGGNPTVESCQPDPPGRSDKGEATQERPTQTRPPEFADLVSELAAVKADVAKHKEVIDDLSRKLAAAQSRGSQPASSALGPGAAPPAQKAPVSTKRNGHGEAKLHRP
jgi:hypothetical protein